MLTKENKFSTISVHVVKLYPGFEILEEKTSIHYLLGITL